jgi:arsenate reductase (thioredoxin)
MIKLQDSIKTTNGIAKAISGGARLKILFLCTGNSCRSQMGEGWARYLKDGEIEAYSAGTKPHGLNRVAVKVMMQAGVDISEHGSKKISRLDGIEFDYVVTVCDNAQETCPVFPGNAKVVHKSFDDPPRLSESAGSEEEAMEHYVRVRDEIRVFVESMPSILLELEKGQGPGSQQMSLGL